MVSLRQQIDNPFGITAFGSAIIRVSPDIALLNFSVTRTHPTPKEAFDTVHEGATSVRRYLGTAEVDDVQSSHVGLSAEFRYDGTKQAFVGYKAVTRFRVLLKDLSKLEELLVGIVDAGVNSLGSVEMQTTQLKEIRARARRQAVVAAREKAELYCDAAGVKLGSVLHIEDVNPDSLRGYEGHAMREISLEDSGETQAFDPGSIAVNAAVLMAFALQS